MEDFKEYYCVIEDGKVVNTIAWDSEADPDIVVDGDGLVKITAEVVEYVEFVPLVGDRFITTGAEYSVPPGTFISSNP